ncbi:MAG: hypothetical protein RLZZ50_284 [Verrucomicrobiota bacterium]
MDARSQGKRESGAWSGIAGFQSSSAVDRFGCSVAGIRPDPRHIGCKLGLRDFKPKAEAARRCRVPYRCRAGERLRFCRDHSPAHRLQSLFFGFNPGAGFRCGCASAKPRRYNSARRRVAPVWDACLRGPRASSRQDGADRSHGFNERRRRICPPPTRRCPAVLQGGRAGRRRARGR